MNIIDMDKEARDQQLQIILAIGREELLSQLTEECCELGQAAQKVRRVLCGTTPVTMDEAVKSLVEKAGDVLLLLDFLERTGDVDMEEAVTSARGKLRRWYGRVIGNG